MDELVQTVREKGVLAPIIVRPSGDGYQLISGERRWQAAKMAGLEQVPAIRSNVSSREALELSIIENVQREDLTPLEEARAFDMLLGLYDMTHDELAQRVGKDRSTITNALRLLGLSESVQVALEQGDITAGHARCFLSFPVDLHETLLKAIKSKDLSVRATEKLSKDLMRPPVKPAPSPPQPSIHLDEVRNKLRSILSTQVRIIPGKKRGKIVIEYYTEDDLNRLVELLSSLHR
jgi:ParB family chromosome partitioning protein